MLGYHAKVHYPFLEEPEFLHVYFYTLHSTFFHSFFLDSSAVMWVFCGNYDNLAYALFLCDCWLL